MIEFLNSSMGVQGIMTDIRADDKKTLLGMMAARAAKITGLHERIILDGIMAREKLGCTGVGKGVALSHARLANCPRVVGLFAQLHAPIDFNAMDGHPVDLVFMLLSPADAGADHLQALTAISQVLSDTAMTAKLRGAASTDAILALLTQTDIALAA